MEEEYIFPLDEYREQWRRNTNLLRPRTGWDHWWRMGQIKAFFQWLWYAPKRIWMRCKYGWCGYDMWDMDRYFLWSLVTALRYFADHTVGYPMNCEEKWGDTHSEDEMYDLWVSDIRAEADLLEEILYEMQEFPIDAEAHDEKIKKALDWIGENWFGLWW